MGLCLGGGSPRLFAAYPDLPPRLVGHVRMARCSCTGNYRGDIKVSRIIPGAEPKYRAHGQGTLVGGVYYHRESSVDAVRTGVTGKWRDGHVHGRAAVWYKWHHYDDGNRDGNDLNPARQEPGRRYFEGVHVDGDPHEFGVLIGTDIIYAGTWSRGDTHGPGRSWRTIGHHCPVGVTARNASGVGTNGLFAQAGCGRRVGLVRAEDGTVAFSGDMEDGRPIQGQAFDSQGLLVYSGNFGRHGIDRGGTLYLPDGRIVRSDSWHQRWELTDGPNGSDDDNGNAIAPCDRATLVYPNGDTVAYRWTVDTYEYTNVWRPVVRQFGYSEDGAPAAVAGSQLSSALGWQVVVPGRHNLDDLDDQDSDADAKVALVHTHLWPLCSGHLNRRRWMHDFLFWPCVYPRGRDYPEVDDAIQFVQHMTSQHHSDWRPTAMPSMPFTAYPRPSVCGPVLCAWVSGRPARSPQTKTTTLIYSCSFFLDAK